MITKLSMKNFRGVREAEVDLAPITVLTGANNSGKSTVMYALLTLKNILFNSNQPLDSFFNFTFLNLGGFRETVFQKDEANTISLAIASEGQGVKSDYSVSIGKSVSSLGLKLSRPYSTTLTLDISFPYPANKTTGASLEGDFGIAKISWNGINPTINIEPSAAADSKAQEAANEGLAASFNMHSEDLRAVDFVPPKRGFFKPLYSAVALQPQLITEDEIATFMANDRDLEGKINFYLEKILNKNFNVRPLISTANFHLQTMDRNSGFVCDLVNEGFGTNQLVYILAKALRKDQKIICIEEPEIHLHPQAISSMADALIDIAIKLKKKIILSTHSEHLVITLLLNVAKKNIAPDQLNVYFVSKDMVETRIEKQTVNENGQIEGGLASFYDAELAQLRDFLKVAEGR